MKKTLCGCVAGLVLLAWTAIASAEEGASTPKPAARSAYPAISMFELIDRVARKTGKRFVADPRVNLDVPLPGLDVKDVDFETLQMIFRLQQISSVTQNGIVNVMPDANARQFPTPVLTDDDPRIGPDELVTRVMRVENVCASGLVPILRPMMPQAAHLTAHPASGSLILSDRAANVRRIAELVRQLDRGPKQTCKTD